MNKKGVLIVLSGFSGAGKGTIVKKLLSTYDNYALSISMTTRNPRPGEEHGREYFFVEREVFEEHIAKDELVEYAQYVGNYYGTPEAPLDKALAKGQDILLDIEVQGALNVKKRRPDAVLIFLMAPSFSELEKRLTGRGDTAADIIQNRLTQARWEYSHAHKYDYLVVNDQVDKAVSELSAIICAEKCKTESRINLLKEEP